MQKFKFGLTSKNYEPHSGMPPDAITLDMNRKILRIVSDDSKLKAREISKMVNILTERLYNILHNRLDNLDVLRTNPKKSLRCFVTVNEWWIHHHAEETKEQSIQWLEAGGNAPKRTKTQQSATKVTATGFWDVHGIIHIVYVPGERKNNHCSLLKRIIGSIRCCNQS